MEVTYPENTLQGLAWYRPNGELQQRLVSIILA